MDVFGNLFKNSELYLVPSRRGRYTGRDFKVSACASFVKLYY